jgi:hypothetical protein
MAVAVHEAPENDVLRSIRGAGQGKAMVWGRATWPGAATLARFPHVERDVTMPARRRRNSSVAYRAVRLSSDPVSVPWSFPA